MCLSRSTKTPAMDNALQQQISSSNNSSSNAFTRSPVASPPTARQPVVSPPPSLVPTSAMSMVSMASMLGSAAAAGLHPPPFGFPPGYPDHHHSHHLSKWPDSPPPPPVPNNDPSANECKIVDYRGEKIAAFTIGGKTMLCLPQAFELFLKHLVGGLHTVYTKLKRLEITPVVCNVEQVRILRGLGAIQPGVNRCKLLGDTEFDSLYKDCTTSRGKIGDSRPGRPPKRGVPFPSMSPQDAMLHLKNSMHNGSELYKDVPYGKEARLDKSGFGGGGNGFPGSQCTPPGINPAMAAQFMALNHPAAFLSAGGLPPFPGLPASSSSPNPASSPVSNNNHNNNSSNSSQHHLRGGEHQNLLKSSGLSSLEALQRSGLLGAAYFERMREGQKSLLQEDERRKARESSVDSVGKDTSGERTADSPVLNLSSKSEDPPTGKDLDASSELSAGSDRRFDDEEMPSDPESGAVKNTTSSLGYPPLNRSSQELKEDTVNNNNNNSGAISALGGGEAGSGQLNSVYGLIGNIQALLKVAVENAKQEERHLLSQKSELKSELLKEKESQSALYKELQELKRNTAVYMRRFKKEKKFRRRLQEQLSQETKRRLTMEDALRATSAETLKRITESLQKEMEENESASASLNNNNSPDKSEDELSDGDDDVEGGENPSEGEEANEESKIHESSFNFSAAAAAHAAAAVAAAGSDTSEISASSPGGAAVPHRDTPSIGFAKNLFPFNGSSLFTSAN
eukprot:TRINITY_DN765_c0_g1_i1.p1 TRINITY_DN765_c0_g1~~TRINITY_DN765_c0_g1_i1.p1  ORF type:complete len:739 (+),score=283.40 TRINITY_DN765_c0_g1_i1:176-2392(+)